MADGTAADIMAAAITAVLVSSRWAWVSSHSASLPPKAPITVTATTTKAITTDRQATPTIRADITIAPEMATAIATKAVPGPTRVAAPAPTHTTAMATTTVAVTKATTATEISEIPVRSPER